MSGSHVSKGRAQRFDMIGQQPKSAIAQIYGDEMTAVWDKVPPVTRHWVRRVMMGFACRSTHPTAEP
jgi:hypothetical protein